MCLDTDWVWGGGRLRAALGMGLPAGLLFGGIVFAESGSAGGAVFGALFVAVFFGTSMAMVLWRQWPGAKDLPPADRHAVARAVRGGEDIREPGLAPAVIEYCATIRRTQERDRRHHWILLVFAGLAAVQAVADTFGGSARSAIVSWLLVVFWVVFLLWLPRQRERIRSNLERAETHAQQLLQRSSGREGGGTSPHV